MFRRAGFIPPQIGDGGMKPSLRRSFPQVAGGLCGLGIHPPAAPPYNPLVDPTRLPLFLFSGLGADERMFRHQREAFPELVVPRWLRPHQYETLRQYAMRMAAQIDPHQPCLIGGASFGGFLALEMLPYLNAKACVLIGAVRSPEEMPWQITFFRPAHRLCRILPYEVFALMCGAVRLLLGPILPRTVRVFLE